MLFVVLVAVTGDPLIVSLLALSKPGDPIIGVHDAAAFSMDVLAPLLPGGMLGLPSPARNGED